MARPRRGTPGATEAVEKWRATMIEKCGGEEGLRKRAQLMGAKGGSNSRTGGFASQKKGADGLTGPERARIVGSIGGSRSRRGPAKKNDADILAAEEALERESGRD